MTSFGPLAAEIDPVVWGTPANFKGFCVLAALLHGILWASAKLCGVEQRAPPTFGRATITLGIGHILALLFSSPNVRRHRLDVGHTYTHGVALVQI